jgi:hypothetical protein
MRTKLWTVGLGLALGAAVIVTTARATGTTTQLPLPGVDTRPMDSRIVEPLPLPVTGSMQVTASATLPVQVVDAGGTPLRVQVVNPPAPVPGAPVEQGRCYQMDVDGDTRSQVLWRVEDIRGSWLRVRAVKGAAVNDRVVTWINADRALRISEALSCE